MNDWLPPQVGVVPKIRIGRRWINVLLALPLGFVLLVIGVAVAQALRESPAEGRSARSQRLVDQLKLPQLRGLRAVRRVSRRLLASD